MVTQVLGSESTLIGHTDQVREGSTSLLVLVTPVKLCWSLFCEPEVVKAWVPAVICAMTALQPQNPLPLREVLKLPLRGTE